MSQEAIREILLLMQQILSKKMRELLKLKNSCKKIFIFKF